MDNYTIGKIVDQVSDVLCSKLSSKHLTVPDHDRFLDIAVKFRERWNFPNVIDCIDGKHIHVNLLKHAGYVMHQQFNIQQLYALPSLYLCVLYLSENKQRLVPVTA